VVSILKRTDSRKIMTKTEIAVLITASLAVITLIATGLYLITHPCAPLDIGCYAGHRAILAVPMFPIYALLLIVKIAKYRRKL
jgi:membrane protein implicated in regulation of membrane protease activity